MTASTRILILFAHPALQKSRINRALLDAIADLDGVTVNDLYEEYPDLHIDVKREQKLLREHDLIIWQHPFFWYCSPAILKKWQDLVLSYGFAYGHAGDALHGKKCLSVISTGGVRETYAREGDNHYSMRELLVPFEQTARLCGMEYLPPFVIHGALKIGDRQQLDGHVKKYRQILEAIRDDQIQWPKVSRQEYINDDLSFICSPSEVSSA